MWLPSYSSRINCLMKEPLTWPPGTAFNVISIRHIHPEEELHGQHGLCTNRLPKYQSHLKSSTSAVERNHILLTGFEQIEPFFNDARHDANQCKSFDGSSEELGKRLKLCKRDSKSKRESVLTLVCWDARFSHGMALVHACRRSASWGNLSTHTFSVFLKLLRYPVAQHLFGMLIRRRNARIRFKPRQGGRRLEENKETVPTAPTSSPNLNSHACAVGGTTRTASTTIARPPAAGSKAFSRPSLHPDSQAQAFLD